MVLRYGRMIRFSHSVFALPFTLSGVLLVAQYHSLTLSQMVWILVAMVLGRSSAMGINRIVDRELDARNPRTQAREIPKGVISLKSASLFTLVCMVLFVMAAFQLNSLCGILSLPVLALFVFYPYTKRFTWMSHFILGLSLGLAPLGAWLAIAGSLQGPIILLGLSVLFWVAGFDIIYACQDAEFDQKANLYSIPVRFGIEKSLRLAIIFHGVTVACLIWVGISFRLNGYYYLGCLLVAVLLLFEHSLVHPNDLSRVQRAFNLNGWMSVLYLIAVWMGIS